MVSSGAKLVPTVAFVACEAPESQRHNIILVMVDDQGIGDHGEPRDRYPEPRPPRPPRGRR